MALTADFKDSLQSSSPSMNGGVPSNQPMSDEQFSQWAKPTQTPQKDGTIKSLAKSLISAPATMLARPVQAIAEAAGASSDSVDKVTSKLTGGIVAPVPQNAGDVKKDVGRGVQTVALGMGSPVVAGAAFGAGNSLEQGNDLFSGQTAFQTVLGAGAGKVISLIGEPILNATGKVVGKITPQFLSDIASQGAKAITDFAAAHDIMPQVASDAINTADKAVTGAVKGAEGKVSGAIGKAKDAVASKVRGVEPNDLQTVNEMITPKSTVKEAKLATDQGRLYKGKESTLLGESGPDKVAASDSQARATRTIVEKIPGAAQMDEPTLYSALKEEIGKTAEALKPEMEKVVLKPETVQKITDDWSAVKKEQASNAYTPSDVNVEKLQQDFESRLQKSESGNMNDLWETRQAYDDSVPDAVKRANELSSESLQAKKEMWLQNRRVLTDAINDAENGLGEASKKPFSEMHDMYEGKNGIISKAKIEKGGEPSKVGKFMKTTPGKVLKYGVGAVTGGEVLKHALP